MLCFFLLYFHWFYLLACQVLASQYISIDSSLPGARLHWSVMCTISRSLSLYEYECVSWYQFCFYFFALICFVHTTQTILERRYNNNDRNKKTRLFQLNFKLKVSESTGNDASCFIRFHHNKSSSSLRRINNNTIVITISSIELLW